MMGDEAGPPHTGSLSLRLLLAHPGHLGDVLLALPAATALRDAFPDAHIAFMVAPPTAEVTRRCPDVDETIAVSFPPLGRTMSEIAPHELARAGAELEDHFDLAVVCGAGDVWSGEVATVAGIPIRVGYEAPGMDRFLTRPVPFDGRPHVVIQLLRLVQEAAACLGLSASRVAGMAARVLPPATVRFVPTDADEQLAARALAQSCPDGGLAIVFQPGSSVPLKSWPTDRWGRLGIALRRGHGSEPLVNGGPGEAALVRAVVDAGAGSCASLADGLSVGALAALFRRSSLLVSVDSGPLHLAAMVGLPVVGLYGPLPSAQWRPWCRPERCRVLQAALPCSPCDRIFAPPCGVMVEPACMTGIVVQDVFEAASELLATA
jgi:ADP-heptose:LPS heptosyltransferase